MAITEVSVVTLGTGSASHRIDDRRDKELTMAHKVDFGNGQGAVTAAVTGSIRSMVRSCCRGERRTA